MKIRKRLLFLLLLIAIALPVAVQNNAALAAEITVSRKADIVFVIDTTGSMGSSIANVKRNIDNFVNKVEKENVDVRVRIVSFRDAGPTNYESAKYPYENPLTYPADGSWYTKSNIADAKTVLETGPFQDLGGGMHEAPLVVLADILNQPKYFYRNTEESDAKFVVLITDESYAEACYAYDDTTSKAYGNSDYVDTLEGKDGVTGKKGIVEEMKKRGINVSVVVPNSLKESFNKFVTKPSTLDADDGGMSADIYGNFDLLFEKLAEKVITVSEQRAEERYSKIWNQKPVKVKANMIVLRKNEGCTYAIASGASLNSAKWEPAQSSPVFKGLQPSTSYCFKVIGSDGSIYDQYVLKTESSTGARFKSIPRILYEGEVYNIKLDADMTKYLATSGAAIEWSCPSDCVTVTNDDVGYGCQMSIVDCQYDNNKLLKLKLFATVTYSVRTSKGEYRTKTKKFKKEFQLENTVDAMEIGTFNGTSENVYKDGLICLGTTEKVSLDIILNQGESGDTPSKQKLTYFISDEYGNKNSRGTKIARVNSGGYIQGVNAGVTYVTIAPKNSYNKFGRCYDYFATIPIICQPVVSVEFDDAALKAEDPNVVNYQKNDKSDLEDEYLVVGKVKDKLELRKYLSFNPSTVFNVEGMKQVWTSSDTSVATVNRNGRVKCKGPGYAVITVTPVGGLEMSAATGKRDINAQLCATSIVIKVTEE